MKSGYIVDYSDDVETDFRICEFAASWKRSSIVLPGDNRIRKEVLGVCLNQIAVIGNDSDFISLSPPGKAPGSLVPYNPNKPEAVKHYRPILFQPKWMRPKVRQRIS
jgi:hypothetical protein